MPIRKAHPRHAQAATAVGHLPDYTRYKEIPDALRAGDDGGCCAFRIAMKMLMPIRNAQPRHAQAASAVGHLPDFTRYDEIPDALRAGDDGGCCAFRIGMKMFVHMLSILCLMLLLPEKVAAQSLLPEGIGLYRFGYRSIAEQTVRYDSHGDQVPLGQRFDKRLNGANILRGKGGPDLQRLAEELAEYDSKNSGSHLADSLDLGSVRGDVKADVKAQFIGLGFGMTPKLTLFLGIPWIDATVRTQIVHDGLNNAAAIKSQLGDLAFSELADGLDRASRISSSQIQDNIEAAGYAPLDEWSRSGVGDLKLGAKTSFNPVVNRNVRTILDVTGTLAVPTGYTEDPDILTDVSFGRGYYSLGLTSVQQLVFLRTWQVGFDVSYAKSLAADLQKRLPEDDEDIIDADRVTTVTVQPGDDHENALFFGYTHSWFEASYRAGVIRHFGDRYLGDIDGNYARLSEDSSTYQAFHEISVVFSSADAYRHKTFPVPGILAFKVHRPLEARNSTDERYYEASIASFFQTPKARPERRHRVERRPRSDQLARQSP